MAETLGVELWGEVLRHLLAAGPFGWPPHSALCDLQSARLAARIFDQASREHMERYETMRLGLHHLHDLNWARFPRLLRLEMIGKNWESPNWVWEALPCSQLTTLI